MQPGGLYFVSCPFFFVVPRVPFVYSLFTVGCLWVFLMVNILFVLLLFQKKVYFSSLWYELDQFSGHITGLLVCSVYSSGFSNNPFNIFKCIAGQNQLMVCCLANTPFQHLRYVDYRNTWPLSFCFFIRSNNVSLSVIQKIDIANAAAPMSSSVSFLATFSYFLSCMIMEYFNLYYNICE